MKRNTDTQARKTFFVSYTLYDSVDMNQYPGIRQFCETRFNGKFLQDRLFVCSTPFSSNRIAQEVYERISEETGQEGQVVVIDGIQAGYAGPIVAESVAAKKA